MKLVGLVDVNNFFVSCERVFNPKLHKRPVVVLSNNDGCVVARSQEAKDLGIEMCVPWFQVKSFQKTHQLVYQSSNYKLYENMSARVVHELKTLAHEVIPYSIDEAFIQRSVKDYSEAFKYGKYVTTRIKKDLGLPVCIGLAPTKTLAKIANHIAKHPKNKVYNGCYVWGQNKEWEEQLMRKESVAEVWGVGRKLVERLNDMQIFTIADLKNADPRMIRSKFNIVVMRTVLELNGQACIEDHHKDIKESLVYSRMFSRSISSREELETALVDYTFNAVARLRGQQTASKKVYIFANESYHRAPDGRPVSISATASFDEPSDDPLTIVHHVKKLLREHYYPGANYARAGVIFYDLSPTDYMQPLDVFAPKKTARAQLNKTYDLLTKSYGSHVLKWGAQGLSETYSEDDDWRMKRNHLSPSYLSNWKELPTALVKV
ncbi:MAG: Y-family DNA polymerase [Micrococcaceae bacterium]